ncbi:MAG: DEAD/DEAH box helicase [Bacteroidales bacterium]|nr:DEAD/DEAH box helicase [Bacteroidales bacterium]
MNFSEFSFHPDIVEGVRTMGFEQATPIQEQAIPIILRGNDLIGCAQTGTGKTAAFVLPLLSMLAEQNLESLHVRVLIIVPTRELALQIDQAVEGFSYFSNVGSIAVYGGNDGSLWDKQRAAITNGTEIVIATPGRLFQHIQMGYVDFSHVQYLVLDEADRMLDMGFYDDIMEIIKLLPEQRQTMMFSATMPPKIRELAKAILREPEEISIAVSKPADNITQMAYIVSDTQKIELLCSLLQGKEEVRSAIVFVSRKADVRTVEQRLKRNAVGARAIYSDIDQREREEVLREFKNRKFQVLVATDIISRGIDIEDIDLVVNYDIPKDPEDYVHRIGRTARAQSDGVAITLISPDKRYDFAKIEKFLESEVYKQPYKLKADELGDPSRPAGSLQNGGRRRGGQARKGHKPRGQRDGQNAKLSNGAPRSSGEPRAETAPTGDSVRKRTHRGGKKHRRNKAAAQGGTANVGGQQ